MQGEKDFIFYSMLSSYVLKNENQQVEPEEGKRENIVCQNFWKNKI